MQDISAPVIFNVPNDITVNCESIPSPPSKDTVIFAIDNCDIITLQFTQIVTPGICENQKILTRTWTATDNCGNQSSEDQIITVIDCQPDVTISINPNPVCQGEDVVLNATITNNYSTPFYQWQFSTDNSTWKDINQGTTVPFIISKANQSNDGFYRLIIADTQGNITNPDCSVISNSRFLTVLKDSKTDLNITICQGQSYQVGLNSYTEPGVYRDTFVTASGCDSIVKLELSVNSPSITNLDTIICAGDNIIIGTNIYNSTGIYMDTLSTSNGCDSIVELDLKVQNNIFTNIDTTLCFGESIHIGNDHFDATGIYTISLNTAIGCDSIINLNLQVLEDQISEMYITICQGESYEYEGVIYNISGDYPVILTSKDQCDSLVIIHLLVTNNIETHLSQQICSGDSIVVGDTTLNTTGQHSIKLTSSSGCDSTVYIDLEVLSEFYQEVEVTICDGETHSIGNQTYDESGVYYHSFVSQSGCDSIVLLTLLVLENKDTIISSEICQGDYVTVGGQSFDQSGEYTVNLIADNGCDSVITLQLMVHQSSSENIDTILCYGDSLITSLGVYNTTGIFEENYNTVNGCDSIVIYDVSVQDEILTHISANICPGDFYSFAGQQYYNPGSYTIPYVSINDCDSNVLLTINLLDTSSLEFNINICSGSSYEFFDTTLTTAGSYTKVFSSQDGCDSIVTVHLELLNVLRDTLSVSICENEPYTFNTNTYFNQGYYDHTYTAISGCDSILTLHLIVTPESNTILNESICNGDYYDFNGKQLSNSGTFVDTFQNKNGCDSLVTLNLQVNDKFEIYHSEQICSGEIFSFNGHSYSESGTYVDSFSSINGCDSIVSLNLTVIPTLDTTITVVTCDHVFVFNGTLYNQSGQYIDSTISSYGCDSIIYLDLTIIDPVYQSIDHTLCEGETYAFNGTDYNTSGTYTATLTSSSGCDSIVTLNLTVNPISYQNITYTICNGDTFSFNGTDYNTSGTYTATLTSSTGCDSVITLDLTVLQPIQTNLNEQICNGDSYSFNGTDYNTSGTYSATLTSSSGCDSTVTLNLIVKEVLTEVINQQICNGQSVDFNGTTYNSTGSYTATLTSSLGCDSIVTLNLTVTDQLTDTVRMQICSGQSQVFNGQVYNQTGTYSFNITSSNGCDSTAVLVLNVLNTLTESIDHTLCEGEAYTFNGTDYNTSGTYTATLTSSTGCDSIVTLNLTVNPIGYQNTIHTICAGDTYSFNGTDYNTSGTYTATLTSSTGCDSVITLDLTVLQPIQTNLNEQICNGDSYSFNGTDYNTSGTYSATLTSSAGCDSTVTLNLIVKEVLTEVIDQQICNGQSVDFNGTTYNSTGSYTATLTSSLGCDSIVTLNLTVSDQLTDTIRMQICNGQSQVFNGQVYNQTGTYSFNTTSSNGCDSTAVLILNVLDVLTESIDHTLCEGEAYTFNGTDYNTSGTYTTTLTSSSGCDSIVTLNLTVNPISYQNITHTICNGDTYSFNGTDYNTSGTYTATLTSSTGCDSAVTLDLNVLQPIQTNLIEQICNGDSYSFNGTDYNTSGTYSATLTSSAGCDSTVTLNLIVNEVLTEVIDQQICNGQSVDFNGTTYNSTGSYTATLTSSLGCDSIVTLNLTVTDQLTDTIRMQICNGQSQVFNGQVYDQTGTYSFNTTSSNGCDSTAVLVLTQHPHRIHSYPL